MVYTAASYTSVFHQHTTCISLLAACCDCEVENWHWLQICWHDNSVNLVNTKTLWDSFELYLLLYNEHSLLLTECSNLSSPLTLSFCLCHTHTHTDVNWHTYTSHITKSCFPLRSFAWLTGTRTGSMTGRKSKTATYQLVCSLTCGLVLFLAASSLVKCRAGLSCFLWEGLVGPPKVKLQGTADRIGASS